MLGLELREEFRGKRLKGTQIELPDAVKLPATDFLRITYPTTDVLTAVESIGPSQERPVVLIGERGQGKSHLMATLVHALTDTTTTGAWLRDWATRLAIPKVGSIALRSGMHVISENLHRQNYKFLWDLLFDRHPRGEFIRGKWEAQGEKKTHVPSADLLIELFKAKPTALVLDEYQTWYDGLTDTPKQKSQTWAFNFIQLLSEIAKDHPDLLVLVVSLRNGHSDAYQQVLRVNPVLVDWKGQNARKDRQRLLLHRLFENRIQVPSADIQSLIQKHVSECLRLLDVPPSEYERTRRDFLDAWPFSPYLMQLLEDQVLVATSAQETRDLIKILADLFKCHGDQSPLLTAADFRLDDDRSGIASLLDSVANHTHQTLREKALRNLEAVSAAVKDPNRLVPHLSEIVASLWVRSLADGNAAGATAAVLHTDITRASPVDDNAFRDELDLIVENSFNIHQQAGRLVFRDEENPQARLMASARNDKLFDSGQPLSGKDLNQLSREVRYVIGDAAATQYRVIVLARDWLSRPWENLDESERPERWLDNRVPLIVLPECPDKLGERLGRWLKEHLPKRRNTVRFLLPFENAPNAYFDRSLLLLSRAVTLADDWKASGPEYRKLHIKYEGELRNILKKRFDRFAVLERWNFADPTKCTFHVIAHKAQGTAIPEAIDKQVHEQLFIPEDFEALVLAAAQNADTVAKLLGELQEPRPNGEDCIPWLGETTIREKIERLCARGKIAIDLRGSQYLQAQPGEDEASAWPKIAGKLETGRRLEETKLLMPQAVPGTAGKPKPADTDTAPARPDGQGTLPGGLSTIAGPPPHPMGTSSPPTPGGTIFTGGATRTHSAPATSPLNLMHKVESWGISPYTQVRKVTLQIEGLTGSRLTEVLKRLPDGVSYALDIEREDA